MSSIHSRGSEDFPLDSNEPECVPSPSAKLSPSAELCSPNIGQASHAIRTSGNSMPLNSHLTEFPSMSSAAGFHAKTLAKPEKVPESAEIEADCGSSSGGSVKKSGLNSRSSKTSQPFGVEALEEFFGIYPASGMTRNGRLFLRAQWVPHTHETGCSLWPTPRADGGNNAGGSNSRRAAIKRGTYITGKINPNHREWLMGYPQGWSETKVLEMPSSRKSRKLSAAQS